MKSSTTPLRSFWSGFFGPGYKPFWMFWHPGSGMPGGAVFGAVIAITLKVLGVFDAT